MGVMSDFVEKHLGSFRLLSLVDQRSTLISLLDQIKSTSTKFQELLLFVEQHPIIRSDFLVHSYQQILELLEAIEIKNKGNAELRYQEIQKTLSLLKEKEQNILEQESPEDVLCNL